MNAIRYTITIDLLEDLYACRLILKKVYNFFFNLPLQLRGEHVKFQTPIFPQNCSCEVDIIVREN